MKIPKSLNIFSVTYKISIEKDFFLSDEDDNMLRGECDLNSKIIRITKLEETNMLQTLLHEVIHAICHEMDLYEGEQNEKFVDSLALGLTDTLIRNKFIKE